MRTRIVEPSSVVMASAASRERTCISGLPAPLPLLPFDVVQPADGAPQPATAEEAVVEGRVPHGPLPAPLHEDLAKIGPLLLAEFLGELGDRGGECLPVVTLAQHVDAVLDVASRPCPSHQAPFWASTVSPSAGFPCRLGWLSKPYLTIPRLAAFTSSSRLTGRRCGASLRISGSRAASAAIFSIASQKASSVSFGSVSVGSIMSASGTISGK